MSSLRRDLVERKLWMVVAVLAVAVFAVPVFLLKGASASTTPTVPAPPAATATTAATTTTATTRSAEPAKVVLARIARDPFASGVPKLSSKPGAATSSGGSSSSAGTSASSSTATTSSSSSSTAPVSMVSPSPATTGSSAATTSSAGSAGSGSATTAGAAPTSTIASTSPLTQRSQPAKIQSWTVYSVSVRFGKDLSVPVKNDLARLTPLPNVMAPQVMFMGVMSDGSSAVFALHAGIGHTGPGLCRPDHVHCSAIVLKAGQTEHLSVPGANGGHQDLALRVVKIASSITRSRTVALDAYHRVNNAGQCELDLANPVSYDSGTGTISSVVKNACQKHPNAVPFAYLVTAP
ncbi:MAG TPA: hypothetical protein VHW96_24245 [Solirubrobacteraceae bacterium]|jgi:hypothetical protein|nr:hypothetical protein [Solirubrobacteraceae bacterium]